jgi:predicted DNA-binding helix-hairpin-helix protein
VDLTVEQKIALLMSFAAEDREGAPPARDPGLGTRGVPGAAGRSGSPYATTDDGAPVVDVATLPPRLRNAMSGRVGALRPLNIRRVTGPRGTRVRLLRILMTNACTFNCHYCPMRRDRNLPRTFLKPAELVRVFLEARRREWCEGLFLTTGIPGRPTKVLDDLIEVLELLRVRHRFAGYVHVKIVPGGDLAQVERITQLATRVSINLETPCATHLESIAPEKRFATALATLERATSRVNASRAEEREGRPRDALAPGGIAGMTTQFVVGATPDTDRTLLTAARTLYRGGAVHHAHFSAFRPIRDTPMEEHPAAPALREHRLYQADHLMRDYRFGLEEFAFGSAGNLPLGVDPKVAIALANRDRYPLDVRTASREALLRVPGIGPKGANAIVHARRTTIIRGVADLRALGVIVSRAAGFLTVAGQRLTDARWVEQLGLWDPDADVGASRSVYEFSPGTFR